MNFISQLLDDTTLTIYCPLHPHNNRSLKEELAVLMQKGFVRVEYKGSLAKVEELLEDSSIGNESLKGDEQVRIVIDRINKNNEDETLSRAADSVQTAFFEGKGDCYVRYRDADDNEHERFFCDRFELDDIKFEEPSPNFFSFNNPYGACKRCEGYGKIIGIDEDLVIPDKSKTIYEGAIASWRGE